ncbi:MAG: DUF2752 domain-containing protein [Sphingobacteriales bacterium]|nr:DUF2752 domain-containing protein [Sphingobacteriales bacterium]
MLTCPSKLLFHFDCPGCGLQTSIIALLRGDFLKSFKIYPATIPILVMFLYLGAHLFFHFKKGVKNLQILYLFCASIIFVSYIYKILILKTN